ncbi:uncharacterized protein LOC143251971 [Tachypleus tridentatus]|uniref:uncharacterized protein LOC143251971 n=1 Tax=Tachypleus tridentatus TaxID=6853 RepID=UPI003FD4AEB8
MSCSVVVDGAPANPTTRGPIYRFIRPRRSIKKELLAQQRNNNNRNEFEIPGNLQGKEHQNIWQKPIAFRQSLRTKVSSDKNETSGANPSGICKPNSQCFYGNKDKSPLQRDFSLTTNSKDCSQSESDTTEKRFVLSQGRSYFLYGYDDNSKIALWNKILSSQEESQHCLKSSLTSSSSQHTLLNNPENTLQKHRPTHHQKSVWPLFENSKHEINVQREPDYVNTNWLRKGCATQFRPSLSSAQESCEFQVTQQTSAPTAPSRRLCERSENVMKIESGARTCRASFSNSYCSSQQI